MMHLLSALFLALLVSCVAGQCSSFKGTWKGNENVGGGVIIAITAVFGGDLSGSLSETGTASFDGITCSLSISGSFSATAVSGESNTYTVTSTETSCKGSGNNAQCSQICSSFNATGGGDEIAVFSNNCNSLSVENVTYTYQGNHSAGAALRGGWLLPVLLALVLIGAAMRLRL